MNNRFKKFLASLLTVVMLLSMLPTSVIADGTVESTSTVEVTPEPTVVASVEPTEEPIVETIEEHATEPTVEPVAESAEEPDVEIPKTMSLRNTLPAVSFTSHSDRDTVNAGSKVTVRWDNSISTRFMVNVKLLDGEPSNGDSEAGTLLIPAETVTTNNYIEFTVPNAAGKYIKVNVLGSDDIGTQTEQSNWIYLYIVGDVELKAPELHFDSITVELNQLYDFTWEPVEGASYYCAEAYYVMSPNGDALSYEHSYYWDYPYQQIEFYWPGTYYVDVYAYDANKENCSPYSRIVVTAIGDCPHTSGWTRYRQDSERGEAAKQYWEGDLWEETYYNAGYGASGEAESYETYHEHCIPCFDLCTICLYPMQQIYESIEEPHELVDGICSICTYDETFTIEADQTDVAAQEEVTISTESIASEIELTITNDATGDSNTVTMEKAEDITVLEHDFTSKYTFTSPGTYTVYATTPNGTLSNALTITVTSTMPSVNEFTIDLGSSISNQLNGTAHNCYVTLPSDGELTLRTSGSNVDFKLYDATGTYWESDLQTGSTMRGWLDAGTYYVLVNSDSLSESYTISASFTAANNAETERNNSTASATPLSLGDGYLHGVLTWQDEVDYYRIDVESAGTLKVQFTTSMLGTDFAILDANGSVLDEFGSSTGKTYTKDVSAGTYYIRFTRDRDTGDYWHYYTIYGYDGVYNVKASFEAKESESITLIATPYGEIVEGTTVIFTAESNSDSVTLYIDAFEEGTGNRYTAVEKEMSKDGTTFTADNKFTSAGKKIVWAMTADGTKSEEIEINVVLAENKLDTPVYTGATTATVGEPITFSWTAVDNATGYTAYVRPANNADDKTNLSGSISGQSVSHTFIEAGSYNLEIYAVGEEGYGASDACNVTITVTNPASCSHLNYRYEIDTTVETQYRDTGDGVNHEVIYSYICYCKDCGAFINDGVKDEYPPTEAHTFDANGVCVHNCGATTTTPPTGPVQLATPVVTLTGLDSLYEGDTTGVVWNKVPNATLYALYVWNDNNVVDYEEYTADAKLEYSCTFDKAGTYVIGVYACAPGSSDYLQSEVDSVNVIVSEIPTGPALKWNVHMKKGSTSTILLDRTQGSLNPAYTYRVRVYDGAKQIREVDLKSSYHSYNDLKLPRAKTYRFEVLECNPNGISIPYNAGTVDIPLYANVTNITANADEITFTWDGSYGVDQTYVRVVVNNHEVFSRHYSDEKGDDGDGACTVTIDGAKYTKFIPTGTHAIVMIYVQPGKDKFNTSLDATWTGNIIAEKIDNAEAIDRNEIIDQLAEAIESDAFAVPFDVMKAYAAQRGGLSAYTSIAVDLVTNSGSYLIMEDLSIDARLHVLSVMSLIENMDDHYYVESVNEANEFLEWLLNAEVDSSVKSNSKLIQTLYKLLSPEVLEGARTGSTFQQEYMKALETSIKTLSSADQEELKVLLYSYNTAANKALEYERFISGVKGVGECLKTFNKALKVINKAVDVRNIFKDYSTSATKIAVLMDICQGNDSMIEAITYISDYYTNWVTRGIETGEKWVVDFAISKAGGLTWALFTTGLKLSPADKIAGSFVSSFSCYELSNEIRVDLFNGIELLRPATLCTRENIEDVRTQCHAWIEIHIQAASEALNLTADDTTKEALSDLIDLENELHSFCDEKLNILVSLLE